MDDETFGEAVLQTITMVVVAIVLSLMVMAAMNVHFRIPEHRAKHLKPSVVQMAPVSKVSDHAGASSP